MPIRLDGNQPDEAYIRRITRALFLALCPVVLHFNKRHGSFAEGKGAELMVQVDDTILKLINGETEMHFSCLENDLLGKFQSQIQKYVWRFKRKP